jgi:hypothetical protein
MSDLEPTDFDALVLDSAVHNMAWLPSVGRAPAACRGRERRSDAAASAECPRAGPTPATSPGAKPNGSASSSPPATPREHRVFGGVVNMDQTPLWGRLVYQWSGVRDGDHRDWPVIEAWARHNRRRTRRGSILADGQVPASMPTKWCRTEPPAPAAGAGRGGRQRHHTGHLDPGQRPSRGARQPVHACLSKPHADRHHVPAQAGRARRAARSAVVRAAGVEQGADRPSAARRPDHRTRRSASSQIRKLAPGETVLDATLRTGLDLPHSLSRGDLREVRSTYE